MFEYKEIKLDDLMENPMYSRPKITHLGDYNQLIIVD